MESSTGVPDSLEWIFKLPPLHAVDESRDVAQARLRCHQAVTTDTLNHPLGIHQGAAGRSGDGVEGIEHGFGLILAQVARAIGLGGNDSEGVGQDVVQIPGDAGAFLFHDEIELGLFQAVLGQFACSEQTAPFLVQRQRKPDSGTAPGNHQEESEQLRAVSHEHRPVTEVSWA